MKAAYYNEIDPYVARWLRNLIAEGHVAPGVVDERSIADVKATDLKGFAQCHFFAGIGVWSYALRLAGWPDDRPVWTGSCPCQPFSAAGKGEGAADPRHLWPEWFRLIRECLPGVVFGEQVSAAIRHGWFDLVSADLEGLDYAVGAAVMGAHSVGAPHIRQRLWFVADTSDAERRRDSPGEDKRDRDRRTWNQAIGVPSECGAIGELADVSDERYRSQRDSAPGQGESVGDGDVGDANEQRLAQQRSERGAPSSQERADAGQAVVRAGAPINGFWSICDWLPCIDGKARPVEPGTFPLAHGAPARVGRLRAYGNAIVPQVAAEFIKVALLPGDA